MSFRTWFSLKGRISRRAWFIFYFLIPNCTILLIGILEGRALPKIFLPQTLGKGFSEFSVVSGLGILFALWLSLAGQVKRWHDQDINARWSFLTLIPTFVGISLLSVFGDFFLTNAAFFYLIAQFAFPMLSLFFFLGADDPNLNKAFAVSIVLLGLSLQFLWVIFFVNGGFLRGTPGPNRFGPDPLAPPDAANIALPPQPH